MYLLSATCLLYREAAAQLEGLRLFFFIARLQIFQQIWGQLDAHVKDLKKNCNIQVLFRTCIKKNTYYAIVYSIYFNEHHFPSALGPWS